MIYNRLPASGFTLVRNHVLRDASLSWRAKALYAYIASHDEAYPLTVEQIVAQGSEGEKAVQSGLRELEAAGHLARLRRRGERGRWLYDWHLIEPDRTPPTATRSDLGKHEDSQLPPCSPHGAAVARPLEDQEEDQREDQELPDASGAGTTTTTPGDDEMTAAQTDPDQMGLDLGIAPPPPKPPKPVNDPQQVVDLFEATYREVHGEPSLRSHGWIRSEVKALKAEGESVGDIKAAAEELARDGNPRQSIRSRRQQARCREQQITKATRGAVEGWGGAGDDAPKTWIYG